MLLKRKKDMYEEWETLIRDSKEGDKEAKEEVVGRLLPLVISSIKSYYNRRNIYEELIQEGNLCILEAIESFREDRNVYFLGYVKTQLRYLYLNKNTEKIHLSLNTKIGEDEEDEILNTLADDSLELDEVLVREEMRVDLMEALNCLTPRQKQIIIHFYVNRMSISEIAHKLDISYRTVVNTKKRALDKLRERLEESSI